jgi:hypothetical protein
MRIPRSGDDVLFCIDEGSADFNTKPQFRPGQVLNVTNYAPNSAVVTLAVHIGQGDRDFLPNDYQPQQGIVPCIQRDSCQYSKEPKKGHWCYFEDAYPVIHGYNVEEISADGEITHGRDIIRDGAMGIWDQQRNTVAFKREDVKWQDGSGKTYDMPEQYEAIYPADYFLDQHVSRVKVPETYRTIVKWVQTDGQKETPDERRKYIRNYGMAIRDGIDASVLPPRLLAGLPPRPEDLQKGLDMMQEAMDMLTSGQRPKAEEDTTTPSDEKGKQDRARQRERDLQPA